MNQNNRTKNERYDFRGVEGRWRGYWQDTGLYRTGDDAGKPDVYILDFFPYPSGEGLSVGHCRNYIPTCVSARFFRMRGYNVLHPMGWDAFGLPAENYAIKHGIHPRESSARFSATFKRQMQLIECSYDWSREISSTDPDFYRWTQWFFLLLYERGLAYRAKSSQWYCPECQTILANEQVEDGRCWRHGTAVVKKELEQWHFRITEYADRLLEDLDTIDWPEPVKRMQRNWIGRSEGAEISFELLRQELAPGKGHRGHKGGTEGTENIKVQVFTTRPDTLYGATFLVLAPEYAGVVELATADRVEAVRALIEEVAGRSERLNGSNASVRKEMAGVFTGRYAVHPQTGEAIPVWVADYVLPGYGTGAIMAVPAHDERDFAFAEQFDLPVVEVIVPDGSDAENGTVDGDRDTGRSPEEADGDCYSGHGVMVNSGPYDGMDSESGGKRITAELVARGLGEAKANYRMRDWLISRQRYWGAPIPMVYCDKCGIKPVPEADLPVLLPDTVDFAPAGDGRSPLARMTDWVNTTCPACGGPARRETDTMDGFACSSWYPLRFTSPDYDEGPFDPREMARWMPVDTYVGGAEHAVMHLLYSRFWTKVMYDAGLVPFVEPFTQLLNQGVLHSAADGQRMSKSKGNVVTPDEVVAVHGTDALRVYILFLGPFDADVVWDDRGIIGIVRFLDRLWRLATRDTANMAREGVDEAAFEQRRQQVIKQVTEDMERYRYNTAVAAQMAYLNYLNDHIEDMTRGQWRSAVETLALLLSPMAPFITEEVWQSVLGHTDSVHRQDWPAYDEALAAEDVVTVVVQVNGRVRDKVQAASGSAEETLRELALGSAKVQRYLNGKEVRRIVVVPDRLVNIVV